LEPQKSNEVDADICHMPLLNRVSPPAKPRKKIGFVVKEKKAVYGKRTKGSRRKK
jgi:hypothetical protein